MSGIADKENDLMQLVEAFVNTQVPQIKLSLAEMIRNLLKDIEKELKAKSPKGEKPAKINITEEKIAQVLKLADGMHSIDEIILATGLTKAKIKKILKAHGIFDSNYPTKVNKEEENGSGRKRNSRKSKSAAKNS